MLGAHPNLFYSLDTLYAPVTLALLGLTMGPLYTLFLLPGIRSVSSSCGYLPAFSSCPFGASPGKPSTTRTLSRHQGPSSPLLRLHSFMCLLNGASLQPTSSGGQELTLFCSSHLPILPAQILTNGHEEGACILKKVLKE